MEIIERNDRFVLGARAHIVEDSKEIAWAEKYVRTDPNLKWVLGNFVEANNPNLNGHFFPLEDLKKNYKTILNKPLNMVHQDKYIVGSFVAAEMLWPEGEKAGVENPYVEALAGFWKHLFPAEYEAMAKAHADGALAFSMEAVPKTLNCPVDGCALQSKAVEYDGRSSPGYCRHMNEPRGGKILNEPTFGGGALILPPTKPGWAKADVKELSEIIRQSQDDAEAVYAAMETEFPHLDSDVWESMMTLVMLEARDVSTQKRKDLAKKGMAMDDGSYPIENEGDLQNAIQSFGRAKNKDAVKKHIMKRAKAMGKTDMLPDDWKQ